MEDTRSYRQIVIDRIQEYVRSISFYEAGKVAYDFESISDHELIRALELLIWETYQARAAYRARQPTNGTR